MPLLPESLGTFVDLRSVGWGVPRPEASVLAHARGLMHWRQRHKFCGVCGNACEVKSSGHVMQCTVCNTQHFPRTDPAVIMLVHRRRPRPARAFDPFPRATMYSTLAGFVEPGETLEEAVRREVLEESGIQVGDVHYHSSQPWPFPGNIMLGFYAEGLTEEITIDPEELKDARWFTRDEMRNCEQHGFALPRVDSIARRLIEDWLAARLMPRPAPDHRLRGQHDRRGADDAAGRQRWPADRRPSRGAVAKAGVFEAATRGCAG